jgi:putative peptidoglycan lipid II flippase
MFPYIGFMSLIALAAGVLNTFKHFAIPAVTPVLLNVAMIAAAWWGAPAFARWGIEPIYAMAAGVMAGGVLQLALILWALKTQAIWPNFTLNPRTAFVFIRSDATKTVVTRMLPALLGVSVAQISLLINTHLASRIGAGSVSWLSYADRLMEFPVAMLGVALGVVLVPQLSAAQAKGEADAYKRMLDWGLRWVLLLGLPSAVALMVFAEPLVATLFHHGKFTINDVQQTALAVAASGLGLLGMVAIKVLAPGYFAKDDTKTPALIAVVVLILTQLLNVVLVPKLAHGGLALSIAIGALINASWLLIGLLKRGVYRPQPGWGLFGLQVIAGSALLAVVLITARMQINWLALQSDGLILRAAYMGAVLAAAALIYFGSLSAGGLKLRSMMKH